MKMAVTGHRPNKLGNEYNNVGPYSDELGRRFKALFGLYTPELAISGIALGTDTKFALVALEMGIKLLACVPFKGQEKMWPYASKLVYHEILQHPLTTIKVVSEGGYSAEKMMIRNKYIVDLLTEGDLFVAVYDGTPGGTRNCYEYAKERRKAMIEIDPSKFF